MISADRPRFAACLASLAEVFQRDVSESLATVYFDALSDLPLEEVGVAVRRAHRECRWFPKPAELRERTTHGLLTGSEIYEQLVALKRRCPLRLKNVPPFLAFVVECLGGEQIFLDATDDQWLRKRCEDSAADWQQVAAVRELPMLPRTAPPPHVFRTAEKPLLPAPDEPGPPPSLAKVREQIAGIGRSIPRAADDESPTRPLTIDQRIALEERRAKLLQQGIDLTRENP